MFFFFFFFQAEDGIRDVAVTGVQTCALPISIQVRVGLRPLHRLRAGVAAIREGRIKRLEGQFPTETQPLVEDLNALLQRNEEVVARGRIQAGNLAHGLKTPLSILANEIDRLAADGAPQLAASMRGQITTMKQQIDYQLARARAAASLDVPGARVPVAPSVAAIQRTLEHLYVGRDLQFAIDIPAEHVRSEEHTSELQSRLHLVCRLLLEKKKLRAAKLEHCLADHQRCAEP